MTPTSVDEAGTSRLRLIFDDAVTSLNLGPEVTYGEVARALSEISDADHGRPLAIDLTVWRNKRGSAALEILWHRSISLPAT